MSSGAEKVVAMYQEEQAKDYNQAIQALEDRGVVDSDAAEGEKIATLSRLLLQELEGEEPAPRGRSLSIPWDTLSFVFGILGVLTVVGVFLLSVVFVATQLLL